jgi:MOSC domain-containing protein YiiM
MVRQVPQNELTGAQARTVAGLLRSVQTGRVAPLGPDGVPSAFVKQPIIGPARVERLGLEGDEQADPRVHGGPNKAVYGYAYANYAAWLRAFPQHAKLLMPGGLGENLTLDDCDEQSVNIGDIVQIGSVVLQISEPRQPCFKFALRFNDTAMVRAMVKNGMCGWYYRVLEPGILAAGDVVVLLERPNPTWSIDRVNRQIVQRRAAAAERAEFASLASQS